MVIKDVQSYIAQAAVISEIMSIVQSIMNVYGGGFSYFNLVVFFSLCLPLLLKIKVSIKWLVVFSIYLIVMLLKFLLQGVGEYYLKAGILLIILPIYVVFIQKTTFDDIVLACVKYRKVILFLGIIYVVSWIFFGTYRNASTVTIFLMLMIGYKHIWQVIVPFIFTVVMKTQYKVWAVLSFISLILKGVYIRYMTLFFVGISAIVFPLFLSYEGVDWLSFSSSQMSSLDERLNEVRSFLVVFGSQIEFSLYGWPLGSAIESEGLSERGYMHSAYLWLIGTLGLPLFFGLFGYLIIRRTVTWKCFFTRVFLILSSSLTFLFLTNPLCTVLMLADENKASR